MAPVSGAPLTAPGALALWREALARVAPIAMGYVPVGMAYGVLAGKAGLCALNVLAMSLFVYAGSAQLVAVGFFAAGASALSIVATTFVVNLRHLLFSAAVAPSVSGWRKRELAAFAFELTDETFALHANRFAKGETGPGETFGINVIAQSAWVGGTVLGLAASTLITDIRPIGLDYALPAMFIALLAGQAKSRTHLAVALFSGILSTALILWGVDRFGVLAATLAGAALGTLWQSLTKPTSS